MSWAGLLVVSQKFCGPSWDSCHMQIAESGISCKGQESPLCCVTTSVSKLSFCPKEVWANCCFLQFFSPSWFFIGLQAWHWNFLHQGSSSQWKVEAEQFKLGFALPAAYMQLVGGCVSVYILSWVFFKVGFICTFLLCLTKLAGIEEASEK